MDAVIHFSWQAAEVALAWLIVFFLLVGPVCLSIMGLNLMRKPHD